MGFWTTNVDGEPKRSFRFKIIFIGLDDDIVWFAKKVTKPNFTITESKHAFLNHSFYFPGRVEWQEITLTLVDPASPDAALKTNQMIQDSGYMIPASPSDSQLGTMSKIKAATALGSVQIIQMAANGETALETWTLKSPFIKSVKFGELSYEDDNLTEIELGLRYDWAECLINQQTPEVVDQTFYSTS